MDSSSSSRHSQKCLAMNRILEAAIELQEFLNRQGWQFCIIGGLAVLRWGKPRTTQDVDVSLFVEFGRENELIEQVLKKFKARIAGAHAFAIDSKVILAESSRGIAVDIALAQFDFEKAIIERATQFQYAPGVELLTVSAEDLVVLKAFAGREQDWQDVAGIIACNSELDIAFVQNELKKLVELQPENPAMNVLSKYIP